MVKYLIKSTQEIRVEDEADAKKLHEELQTKAIREGYALSAWTETHKERKQKGEVVDEWVLCKATFVFNDQKEPVYPFSEVNYEMTSSANNDVPFDGGEVVSAF